MKWQVTLEQTSYLTYLIEAETAEEAKSKFDRRECLDVLQDDSEAELYADPYKPEEWE